jgi:hypothetical protein
MAFSEDKADVVNNQTSKTNTTQVNASENVTSSLNSSKVIEVDSVALVSNQTSKTNTTQANTCDCTHEQQVTSI